MHTFQMFAFDEQQLAPAVTHRLASIVALPQFMT